MTSRARGPRSVTKVKELQAAQTAKRLCDDAYIDLANVEKVLLSRDGLCEALGGSIRCGPYLAPRSETRCGCEKCVAAEFREHEAMAKAFPPETAFGATFIVLVSKSNWVGQYSEWPADCSTIGKGSKRFFLRFQQFSKIYMRRAYETVRKWDFRHTTSVPTLPPPEAKARIEGLGKPMILRAPRVIPGAVLLIDLVSEEEEERLSVSVLYFPVHDRHEITFGFF